MEQGYIRHLDFGTHIPQPPFDARHQQPPPQPQYQPVPDRVPKNHGRRIGVAILAVVTAGGIFFAGTTYGESRAYKTLRQQPVATAPPGYEPSAEATEKPDVESEHGGTTESSKSTEAAIRFNWGKPLPVSDEFEYGSKEQPAQPDPQKWGMPGNGEWSLENNEAQCWPGHAGNGRRCSKNTQVVGGYMRQTGDENGDTGWVVQKLDRQYGRWEIRSRSNVVGKEGSPYHALHLIWPTNNEEYPEHGEYDFMEITEPDAQCLTAYMHYPHLDSVDTQQEKLEECPIDMTKWHNFGFEWTPEHLKGYVDGKEWFKVSGGSNDVRENIQGMPSGHLNIQLDNFHGSGMRAANFDVDWVRTYDAP